MIGLDQVPHGHRTAAVLSGGGAKGAYEVGVLRALLHGESPATGFRPLSPQIFTGTSVGGFNAACMVSMGELDGRRAIDHLEAVWRRRIANTVVSCGNGVFRARLLPFQFLDPGCFFRPLHVAAGTAADVGILAGYMATRGAQLATSVTPLPSRLLEAVNLASFVDVRPLYDLIRTSVDVDALRRSPLALTVAATDWEAGIARLFGKLDVADVFGLDVLAASAAIPGLFSPVEVGGVLYHDGGVLLNTPFAPAVRDGAAELHVVFVDSVVAETPLQPVPNSVDTVYRMYLIMQTAIMRGELATAAAINQEIELLQKLGVLDEDPTDAASVERLQSLQPASRVLRRLTSGVPFRRLTVHVYRPATDLGGGIGLIDFNAVAIDRLIEMGYRDAVEHDCRTNGCIVTPGVSPEDLAHPAREAVAA